MRDIASSSVRSIVLLREKASGKVSDGKVWLLLPAFGLF